MQKTLVLLASLIITQFSFSQTPISKDSLIVFTKAEVNPKFPGGDSAWFEFLKKNLDMDIAEKNKAPDGTYKVRVRFVVNQDGSLSNIEPQTNFGYGMEQEVIRVLGLSPKWTPALQNGRIVRAYQVIAITFGLVP